MFLLKETGIGCIGECAVWVVYLYINALSGNCWQWPCLQGRGLVLHPKIGE